METKKIYNCGPTLFDNVHIGCYRIFVLGDILDKFFKKNGYAVEHGMNIMDVDDNILNKNISAEKVQSYFQDLINEFKFLKITVPNKLTFTSQNVQEIQSVIEKLQEQGFAYERNTGIYLDISKVKDYGVLSGNKPELNQSNNDYNKKNPNDPSLWRFKDDESFKVFYKNKFGRPGWDIQCATNCICQLGFGVDYQICGYNEVTHYENNRAIIDSYFDKQDSSKWILVKYINFVDSTPYFYMKDFINAGFSAEELRYALYSIKYSSSFDLSDEYLKSCKKNIAKLNLFYDDVKSMNSFAQEDDNAVETFIKKYFTNINELFQELKIPTILGNLFKLINTFKNKFLTKHSQQQIIQLFDYVDFMLRFLTKE